VFTIGRFEHFGPTELSEEVTHFLHPFYAFLHFMSYIEDNA